MASDSSQALLAALAEGGPIDVCSLANVLGCHPTTVDRRCCDLQADGYACHTSSGVYDITAEGRSYLAELNE
ncbi:helix-turn-helix domain-containing protein [Halogranum amylolyticum]|nr:hypothetical protein [Halogranum amylolyticum]